MAAEFRGCENLVCARILKDDATGYQTGAVVELAEVARIAKTTAQNRSTSWYDNKPLIQIKAVGEDTITLVVPALTLDKLAIITGAQIDTATGAYMSGEEDTDYEYALGYKLNLTDGTARYVWRLKGTFNVPDEESESKKNDEITTHNQTVTYTGVETVYKFVNGGSKRDTVVDERDNKVNVQFFFDSVMTSDNIGNIAKRDVTALSITPATKEMAVGDTFRFTLNITPTGYAPTFASSNPTVASIDASGDIVALREGVTVITATAGTLAAVATLMVVAAT
jgi:phi13 family phage major tail protein